MILSCVDTRIILEGVVPKILRLRSRMTPAVSGTTTEGSCATHELKNRTAFFGCPVFVDNIVIIW